MTTHTIDKIVTMKEIKTINNRPRWFQNPLLIPAITILAGLFWLAQNGKIMGFRGPLFLVLLAQGVFLILMLRRPIWGVAALIVGQITACNFMVFLPGTSISLRLLWAIPALLLLMVIFFKNGRLNLGRQAGRIIIPAVIFFLVAALSNYVNTDMSVTLQYLRLNIPAFAILLFLPATVENKEDLKRLALVALITWSLSAVVALLQKLSFTLPIPHFELHEGLVQFGRVVGLSETSIQLAWNLPMALLLIAAIYFLGKLNIRVKILLVLLAFAMITALFLTYTRSGLFSLAPGLILIGIMMKGKHRIRFFLLLLIVSTAFGLYILNTGNRYSQSFGDDSSSTGRLVLWEAGAKIALDHPVLGIGVYQFTKVAPEYASSIDTTLNGQNLSGVLGTYAAHDDFITVWSSFGTVAILAFLLVFVGIFRNFMGSYRKSKDPFLRGLSLGCIAALLSFILNMATHNVMDSTILLWIIAGFSIATAKVALSKGIQKTGEI